MFTIRTSAWARANNESAFSVFYTRSKECSYLSPFLEFAFTRIAAFNVQNKNFILVVVSYPYTLSALPDFIVCSFLKLSAKDSVV
jgi:hypothetical protein